jgi:two-component system, NtrC family, sensor kinase
MQFWFNTYFTVSTERLPATMKPFRFNLTFSILASLACLLGLSWLLLGLISFKTAEKDLLSQKSEAGRIILATFISVLPEGLSGLQGNGAVDRFAANLTRESAFAGITVINREGEQVYVRNDGRGTDAQLLETLNSGMESDLFYGNGMRVSRYAPVRTDGRIVGAARLSLSLAGEQQRLNRSRQVFFAYFLLDFFLLLGFGSYLLSRIVVVPIKKLLSATERLTAGDYGHSVHVPGSAEIAELAESFNFMQAALKNKQQEAESHVQSLERANRDLQAAREETLRSEKMASVGLLAAGMAHEIGAPLTAIIGYSGILQEEVKNDPPQADILRRIEDEAYRIDRLIRGLLDYARPAGSRFEILEIPPLLGDTLEIIAEREVFRNISTSLNMDAGLPPVFADKSQLQQVFVNLMLNARDAMPEGGDLVISAGVSVFCGADGDVSSPPAAAVMGRRKDDFNRSFSGSLKKGDTAVNCIRIDIRDTGEGIPVGNLSRIFDPFFTTKEPGKGTGLGLAICARIIDTFGGRITLASIAGEGTTITLWLPVAGDAEKYGRR